MIGAAALGLYRVLSGLAEPLLVPGLLRRRARAGKEDPARIGERMGRAGAARPAGDLVWLHGASVGESLSLLPFIARLRAERPGLSILVTSGTRTSAALLARRLPEGVIHQFAPVDGPAAVGRFLDHWRPSLGIIAESELWPNLIGAARKRGVRLALVSARITAKSAKGWSRLPSAAQRLLSAFELILPQDEASRVRLERLGARTGGLCNLKFAAQALPFDETERARLRAEIGQRTVVLAASTHPGEEPLITTCLAATGLDLAGLLLIIVPRHPERGGEIETQVLGAATATRSRGEAINPSTQVYLADTLGEMGLFFALADLVVMGGSLIEGIGGHNPLEPARFGKPIISGGEVFNFSAIYEEMAAGGACLIASPSDTLMIKLRLLIDDAPKAAALGAAAKAYARDGAAQAEAGLGKVMALVP